MKPHEQIKEKLSKSKFIASQEDDRENYQQEESLAKDEGGMFTHIIDGGDNFLYENKTHYVWGDCGISSLYKKL